MIAWPSVQALLEYTVPQKFENLETNVESLTKSLAAFSRRCKNSINEGLLGDQNIRSVLTKAIGFLPANEKGMGCPIVAVQYIIQIFYDNINQLRQQGLLHPGYSSYNVTQTPRQCPATPPSIPSYFPYPAAQASQQFQAPGFPSPHTMAPFPAHNVPRTLQNGQPGYAQKGMTASVHASNASPGPQPSTMDFNAPTFTPATQGGMPKSPQANVSSSIIQE